MQPCAERSLAGLLGCRNRRTGYPLLRNKTDLNRQPGHRTVLNNHTISSLLDHLSSSHMVGWPPRTQQCELLVHNHRTDPVHLIERHHHKMRLRRLRQLCLDSERINTVSLPIMAGDRVDVLLVDIKTLEEILRIGGESRSSNLNNHSMIRRLTSLLAAASLSNLKFSLRSSNSSNNISLSNRSSLLTMTCHMRLNHLRHWPNPNNSNINLQKSQHISK